MHDGNPPAPARGALPFGQAPSGFFSRKISIRLRLVLTSTLLVAALLVMTCAVFIAISRRTMSYGIELYHSQLARSFAGNIRMQLNDQLSFLARLGQTPDFHVLQRKSLDYHLENFLKFNPLFKNIWVYAADGRVIALQNRLYLPSERKARIRAHLNENFNRYNNEFKKTANQVIATGRPGISKVLVSRSGYFLLPCVAPIVAKGSTIGILSAGLFLDDVNSMLGELNPSQGGWSMLTQDGKDVVGRYNPSGLPSPDPGELVITAKREIIPFERARLSPTFGKIIQEGRSFLLTIYPMPDLGLELLIAVPEKSVMSTLGSFTREMFIFGFLSLALGIILASLTADRLSRPLQELVSGLRILKTGNLKIRLGAGRKDELGRAMEAFNDLALSLSKNKMIEKYWQEKVSSPDPPDADEQP